jgi:hypothetical protein
MAAQHSGQLSAPALTLTRQRLECAGPQPLEDLHTAFARQHFVRLPRFLESNLLDTFHARVKSASFTRRLEDDIEIEETLADPVAEALLLIPMNDPALFDAVRAITGCGHIGCFTGRVFRRRAAGVGHYYPWHTDATHDRLVAISVNLGRIPHDGGVLQLRRLGTQSVLGEVANTGAGDAVLFRIATDLEHHVTPVTSPVSRLVLAGWFRRQPDFWAGLPDHR